MNITLTADEAVIERARRWAAEHQTSLNQIIRDRLAELGQVADRAESARQFVENAVSKGGFSEGDRPFRREELYSGPRFGDSSADRDPKDEAAD